MAEYVISDERLAELNAQDRAMQEIEDAGGLCAVLRNGHNDATVLIDARRTAADEIEWLRASLGRLKSAVEFAHSEGFQWPSDPMAEFVNG